MLRLLLCMLSFQLFAAPIAIIDSGVDYRHEALSSQMWINPVEIPGNDRDEDRNGYQDDVYGWNFAENNNEIIDFKYIGSFSDTPRKFFEIQLKSMLGEATEEELEWMKSLRDDPEVIKELQVFGNFVHGTHVAGIAAQNSSNTILGVKLLPTEVELPFGARETLRNAREDLRIKLIKQGLKLAGSQQMQLLQEIAYYVGNHGMKVANGSFGTGTPQAKMIVNMLYKLLYQKDAPEDVSMDLVRYFMSILTTEGKKMMNLAPSTLFVFAAGNDALDNDTYPASPANIRAPNSITVAATYERRALAPFSNFGQVHVDIAAPGMGINSAIPGDEYLIVSGTSQAAPFVANIAGQVMDANPELTPVQVKRLLMETVDLKEFLADKVKAKGVINELRAVEAAKLSGTIGLDAAIKQSRVMISDIDEKGPVGIPTRASVVMPIYQMFR